MNRVTAAIAAVVVLALLLLGWFTFFVDGDRAGVDVNPDVIGEDLEKAGEAAETAGEAVAEGAKAAADAADRVEVDVDVRDE